MHCIPVRYLGFVLLVLLLGCLLTIVSAQDVASKSPALSSTEKSIAAIAALTAKGKLPQLSTALNNGLTAGLTVNEEKEVLVHLYAYCGFPRSIQGLNTLMAVVAEGKKKGVDFKTGREATPPADSSNRYQRGKATLETLTGQPEKELKTGYAAFSPEIEIFLKEHLFADIFSRDVLDYRSREIATVSALIGLGGVEPMLKSHLTIALRTGVSKSEAEQLINTVTPYVGKEQATIAKTILKALPSPTQQAAPGSAHAAPVAKNERSIAYSFPQQGLIFPTGNSINSSNFTGAAWLQWLVKSDSLNHLSVGNVSFAPGVRTAWHYHPGGQTLLVTEGTGYYQEQGKDKKILHKGDVVVCQPNVAHWHGAAKGEHLVHVAISSISQGDAVWQQPVTEEEYNR